MPFFGYIYRRQLSWRLACVLLSMTAALAWTSFAFADAYQSMASQRSILPGARASAMGGAFTAVADDPSASYYNPAGLALTKESKIEISATAYQTTTMQYEKTVNEKPFVERSETIVPNFIGGAVHLGWLTLGYSFMTLDARNIYQQDKYNNISTATDKTAAYSRTYQEASTYIWAGGSAAARISDHLSFGTSVFYYQRNIEFSSNELAELNGGGILGINDTLHTLNTGIASANGLLWRGSDWSVGVCMRTAMALSDSSALLVDRVQYDPLTTPPNTGAANILPTVTHTRIADHALDELNPTTYAGGAAWHPSENFLLSGDILLHEAVKTPYANQGGFDLHTTTNYSAGMDVRGGPVALMVGYFTNNSMFRPPDPRYAGQPVYINFRGETFGLELDLSSLHGHLGLTHQYGSGSAQIRSGDPTIQHVVGDSTTYVVAARVVL